MAKIKRPSKKQEEELIEKLREHPELFKRFAAILRVTGRSSDEMIRTADEMEAQLVEEVKRLGRVTIECWGIQTEERVAQKFKKENRNVRYSKKDISWFNIFGWGTVSERIWRSEQRSYNRPFAERINVRSHGVSRLLRRAISDFGADEAFGKAARKVKEHYGFGINTSAVRRH